MKDRRSEVEAIAMATVLAYEGVRGCETLDVSHGYRRDHLERVRTLVHARVPDFRGWSFDIVSIHRHTTDVRFIEVKGRGTSGPIDVIEKEFKTGRALGRAYWLYVVFDCNTGHYLTVIQDPLRLEWTQTPFGYQLAVDAVRAAGTAIAPA